MQLLLFICAQTDRQTGQAEEDRVLILPQCIFYSFKNVSVSMRAHSIRFLFFFTPLLSIAGVIPGFCTVNVAKTKQKHKQALLVPVKFTLKKL